MFFFQAEDGIRDLVRSRGLGDVYKRQEQANAGNEFCKIAIESFTYHIRKYIGAYSAILGLSLIHI